jgi:hypothetical protein
MLLFDLYAHANLNDRNYVVVDPVLSCMLVARDKRIKFCHYCHYKNSALVSLQFYK